MRKFKKILLAATLALALLCSNFNLVGSTVIKASASSKSESEIRDTYSDTWALTDELDRKAPSYEEAGGVKSEKKVGVFYLVWHDKLMDIAVRSDPEAPRNLTQIIEKNPDSFIYDAGLYGPNSSMHYWGEPLYGYYNLLHDDYIVRQHATQLTDAGVDYIVIDATNFHVGGYNENSDDTPTITNILDEYLEMRSEGLKTPEVTFLFTWNSEYNGSAINYFFDNVYTNEKYAELWFQREGKPLVLGSPAYVRADIRDKFSYRRVQPEMTEASGGSWNWLAKFPQEIGFSEYNVKEMMAVGVAQNWTDELVFMTSIDEYGRFNARGRSWTSESSKLLTNPIDPAYNSKYGYNFQEQFDRAIDVDTDMIFVTAWNEWIAGRFDTVPDWAGGGGLPNRANFGDDFSTEFSREIEMTREGGLNDSFYNQLASNIRQFKGVRKAPDYKQVKTMTIDGDMSDWSSVPDFYRDDIGDKTVRDAKSFGQVKNGVEVRYINKTGRNDFVDTKVARDDTNLYLSVSTVDDITPYTDANWMRLFIKTGLEKNYAGFDYAINNVAASANHLTLQRSTGGYNWENVSTEIAYKVNGKQMELSIPLSSLGLTKDNVRFEFKWDDNIQMQGDALSWYTDGDTAPNSRFNYEYRESTQSDNHTSFVELYDYYVEPDTKDILALMASTDVVAAYFESEYDFRGVDVLAFNMLNQKATYKLALYKFDQNYANSISKKPLITRDVTNAYNNTPLYIGAGLLPKGNYLLTVTGVTTTEGNFAGLNTLIGQNQTKAYVNGTSTSEYSLMVRLHSYLNKPMMPLSVTANSGRGADKLTDNSTTTVWETEATAGKAVNYEIVLDLGETKNLFGARMIPYINNGHAQGFPTEFEILSSTDNTTFASISRQQHTEYLASAANQDFRFKSIVKARYLKIKITKAAKVGDAYSVKLGEVSAIASDNFVLPGTDNTTKKGCGSNIVSGGSVASAAVTVACIIGLTALIFVVTKKAKNKS